MNQYAIRAIFTRNFFSYFANPTGYVFLCVFVFLSTIAAFWSNAFFVNNLANLDQLTPFFPFIMLVFAPAITMNSWADERRQGTDELILTLPANDLDVVLGKYFSCLAIYTCSLLFSAICNFIVLRSLGSPDVGLFLATYVGFWFVGVAMLAIGMMASFLTGHITISYVWGVLLNAPFVFSACAEVILPPKWASAMSFWSFEARYAPFCKGELSLASAFYFVAIALVMLYLCMILLGRRHWFCGTRGWKLAGHFALRTVFLAVAVSSVTVILNRFDLQIDCTAEKLNSLCPETIQLLKEFKPEYPVEIHAYLSPQIPGEFAQVKRNLESTLHQFEKWAGSKVHVHIHSIERFTDEALNVEKNYGITPTDVNVLVRGNQEKVGVYLGVAMTCGLNQEVIPFFSRGLPVEYEMIRSLLMVSTHQRKRLGVLQTDANLLGMFDGMPMTGIDRATIEQSVSPMVAELRKSYEIVPVNPSYPIDPNSVDVILAVQPSTLEPFMMENFVKVLEAGVPTAIFEDPLPLCSQFTPTCEQRRLSRNPLDSMAMMAGNLPKADTAVLWNLLGVRFYDQEIVAQKYRPIPRFSRSPNPFLFIDANELNPHPFAEKNPATNGLRRLVMLYAGHFEADPKVSSVFFTPLVIAQSYSGLIPYRKLFKNEELGFLPQNLKTDVDFEVTSLPYIVSAEIRSTRPDKKGLYVILTADSDLFFDGFVQMRSAGGMGSDYDFDNINFVLNIVERLGGENRFYAIRKHQQIHRKLEAIEQYRNLYQKEFDEREKKLMESLTNRQKELEKSLNERVLKLNEQLKAGEITQAEAEESREWLLTVGQNEMQKAINRQMTNVQKEIALMEKDCQTKILQIQNERKLLAVLLPPVLPLLIAILVFVYRKNQERLGVSAQRLRK
ncbi:MAG: Gldg family protein [Thermoguttaceae bacterium]